jgi:hypothetical protein
MGAEIGGVLAGLVCQSVIGSLVGAVILRAACAWYNSMVGRSRHRAAVPGSQAEITQFPAASDNPYEAPTVASHWGATNEDVGVPEPDFGKAWLISFVTVLTNAFVGFILGIMVGAGGAAAGARNENMVMLASLAVSLPASFLVSAALLTVMLPTSFGRAFIVTLLYLVISLLVLLAIGAVILGVMVLVGFNR